MQIIYNVTVKIEASVHEDWLEWMVNVHIPDVMSTGYFSSYKLTKIIEEMDDHGIGFAIQYIAPDIQSFNEYQTNHAKRLQKAHSERYDQKYVAFRTLLEIVKEG
jgi:hypothetical protein